MIAPQRTYSFGDVVVHSRRPEWGRGTVTKAEIIRHNGESAQRLHIRFASEGLKVINTGVVEVLPAEEAETALSKAAAQAGVGADGSGSSGGGSARGGGWLADLENERPEDVMTRLPQEASDPFKTVVERLRFTLELFRFSLEPKSLTEWAIAQSGLDDPLTRFTRQEIEQFYQRFTYVRDQHLGALLDEARRGDATGAREVLAKARPEAVAAVQRLLSRR